MYAIVDIETTGGHAAGNGITEIAVFIHDGMRVVQQFESLVNPLQKIPPYITALTGISQEMVADAPTFDTIAPQLYELLSDKIFVAHNVNFDYSFVRHQLQAAGFDWNAGKVCTVRLSRKVFPGLPSYSLGNLCRSLQIPVDNRHRAGGDAKATVRLLEKCLESNGLETIRQMLKKNSGDQWLPLHLTREDIKQLPQVPGVYYFHDEKDKIIYVGKAVNIRKRVTSHFTHHDPYRKRQHFLRAIRRISFLVCASELHAIVLESTEIRRLWPRFNQSQKQPVQKYGLYTYEDGKGYQRLVIEKKKKHLPAHYTFNLLREGQVMLRKVVDEFGLHEKLCLLNKAPMEETEWQLMERPARYNKKTRQALEAIAEKVPSFAVVDAGMNPGEKLCLLIDQGSFWGMGFIPENTLLENAATLKELIQPYADNDTIRNSIYTYVQQYPDKRVDLS